MLISIRRSRHQVYRNVTVKDNTFVAPARQTLLDSDGNEQPYSWSENFISLGAIDGLTLSGNRMARAAGIERDGPDIVLYSNVNQRVAADNDCFVGSAAVACNVSATPTVDSF